MEKHLALVFREYVALDFKIPIKPPKVLTIPAPVLKRGKSLMT